MLCQVKLEIGILSIPVTFSSLSRSALSVIEPLAGEATLPGVKLQILKLKQLS